MFNEDNSGFIYFPIQGNKIRVNSGDKTLVYLVAFQNDKSLISNVSISLPGDFISDDIFDKITDEDVLKNQILINRYDNRYFPSDLTRSSIPMVSTICIGWSENSYEYDGNPWRATFRDLTEAGKRLYYSIKKLHNNKEVRILTFNNI